MSSSHHNPFSKFRTEYMQDSAWKFFVKDPFKEYVGERPVIFEGSRGTGKTMFFLCNSWKQKLEESESYGESFETYIANNKHFGFYYKVDTRFVTSLTNKNIPDEIWRGIFNTYFNVIIGKEILSFIDNAVHHDLIDQSLLTDILSKVSNRLGIDRVMTIDDMESRFDDMIIEIEHYSNNTERQQPVGTNSGTVIQSMILGIKRSMHFKDKTFHVYVDEFETLTKYQQIALNTLLKHSDADLVFDFGVITKGMLTYRTASGQEIRPKDDFILLKTDSFQYHESSQYNEFLVNVCTKRLKEALDSTGKDYDKRFLIIRNFLVNEGPRYEEALFVNSNKLPQIKARLLNAVKKHPNLNVSTEKQVNSIYESLTDCGPIEMRMHLALLLRKGRNAVSPVDLVNHKESNSKIYREWVHNMQGHLVFLLCHELNVPKKYHGFEVYSALSSGVIRSFLELAEFAFDYAMSNTENAFTFDDPRPFTVEEQTKAVYYVSKFKVAEIDSYEPGGFKLKSFTKALGKIFNSYHTNSNATLGEVEQNHFTTEINDLRENHTEAYQLLNLALRHKILEDSDSNKTKAGFEFLDFHLNHIYCPTFGISHRRQRKIEISASDLSKLLSGTDKDMENTISKLSNTGPEESGQATLFTQENDLSGEV